MAEEEDDGEPKYQLVVPGQEKPREEGSRSYTGSGNAQFVNGDTYEGTFVEGYRQGKGVYRFKKNGDCYEGHYEENRKSGFGKMTYASSAVKGEDGEEEDEQTGPPRGGTYLGFYEGGFRGCRKPQPGQEVKTSMPQAKEGTFSYINGDVYVGAWQEGKKHGAGSYTFAKDGTKLVGEWFDGKITSGQWIFPNGTFYAGQFRYSKPFGRGVWVFKNGNQLIGDYIQKPQAADDEPPEEEEVAEKPDPKVWCHFKPSKDATVRGGSMFGLKCDAIKLVEPPLD